MGVYRRTERKRNPWVVRLRMPKGSVQASYATEAEARAFEAAWLLAYEQGTPLPEPHGATPKAPPRVAPEPVARIEGVPYTLTEACRNTIKAMQTGAMQTARTSKPRPYAPASVKQYESDLFRYVASRIGEVPLKQVNRALINRWQEQIAAEVSDAKARAALDSLRIVMRRGVDLGWLDANPLAGVRARGVEREARQPLTPEEGDALQGLADQENPRLGMFVALALATGARRGEIAALTWGDVAGGVMVIDKSMNKNGQVGPTKNRQGREVPLGPDTRAALKRWALQQGRPGDGDLVIGFPPDKAWRRVQAAWGQPITLHHLRHTAACWWLSEGMSVHAVARLLGHGTKDQPDATLVLKLYGDALPTETDEAGAVMDQMRRRHRESRQLGG